MNDFFELENELKKLRPARPSPVLFERVEEAMGDPESAKIIRPERFRINYTALGFGLAAAAVLLLFAKLSTDREPGSAEHIVQSSPPPETGSALLGTPELRKGGPARPIARPRASGKFIPAGSTQLVYNTRDEGLQFTDGSDQPLRRFRYQTRETWQWRNPATGASLRVSYPSEEVVLIPVSGQ